MALGPLAVQIFWNSVVSSHTAESELNSRSPALWPPETLGVSTAVWSSLGCHHNLLAINTGCVLPTE